jgi:hypothetical protein
MELFKMRATVAIAQISARIKTKSAVPLDETALLKLIFFLLRDG